MVIVVVAIVLVVVAVVVVVAGSRLRINNAGVVLHQGREQ